MAKIKTIEELANEGEVDIAEYGLKAEGLAILKKGIEDLMTDARCYKRNKPIFTYEVDPAFVNPKSKELNDNRDLREALYTLVTTPTVSTNNIRHHPFTLYSPLRIILARSSDENELPGKFETHSVLYNPNHFEKFVSDWLSAAEKVRKSGAGAVIGQALVASGMTMRDLKYEVDEDLIDVFHIPGVPKKSVVFGLENLSFVAKTGGEFGADTLTMASVVGLPSKIVRGDDDYSFIMDTSFGTYITHSSYNPTADTHFIKPLNFPQKTFDFISAKHPEQIKQAEYVNWLISLPYDPSWDTSWGAYAFPTDSLNPKDIFYMMSKLKRKTGKHIEIEGTWLSGEHFPHFLQLRKYDLPKNRLEKLTEIEENRIIQKSGVSYIADKFVGDIVYFNGFEEFNEKSLRSLLNDKFIFVMPNYYEHEIDASIFKLNPFSDMQGLVIPVAMIVGKKKEFSHVYTYTINTLTDIQKKIPVIAFSYPDNDPNDFLNKSRCDSPIRAKFKGRMEVYSKYTIVRDATVESDGKNAQIYLN